METTMINLRVLSTAAAIALVLPIAAPGASIAQQFKGGKGGVAVGGSGAPAARFSGAAPAARFSSSGAPVAHYNGPGASSMARYSGVTTGGAPAARWSGATTGTRFSTGPTVTRYSSGYGGWNGGHRYRRGGGFIPGAVAGAVIGGALASSYGYYDGPGYDSSYAYDGYGGPDYASSYAYYGGPGYYGADYEYPPYDDGAVVAAAPAPVGDDAVAYCMQTYQSYDPASGTYLGYDGLRHPCP
jgi:hypothetical protein